MYNPVLNMSFFIGTIGCFPAKKNKIKNKYRTFYFKTKLRSWEMTKKNLPSCGPRCL